jgi:hypothetical protein
MDWNKIFAKYRPDNRLISRIYFFKFLNSKPTQ